MHFLHGCIQSSVTYTTANWTWQTFYSSILNDNAWVLYHRCNLLWIFCLQASWREFISTVMPRGEIFALLPACYYFAVYFMLLSVMSQQVAYDWEQDHATVLNGTAVSFCSVKLLTDLFLNVILRHDDRCEECHLSVQFHFHSRGNNTWCK